MELSTAATAPRGTQGILICHRLKEDAQLGSFFFHILCFLLKLKNVVDSDLYLFSSINSVQDIDECRDKIRNPCTHKCINKIGSFNCTCPVSMTGDGRKDGSGCNRDKTLYITAGGGLALMVVLFILGLSRKGGLHSRNSDTYCRMGACSCSSRYPLRGHLQEYSP